MSTNPEIQITDDTIVRRNVKRELPCKLTDEEFMRISKQRVTREAEQTQLESDLAVEKKKRQDQIDEIDDEIQKMRRELHTGFQDRTVPCDEVFRKLEDGTGWIFVIRKDTMTEVDRRPATAHETQRYLPGVDGPGAGLLDKAAAAQKRERTAAAAPESDGSDVPSDDSAAEDDEQEEGDEGSNGDKPKRGAAKKKGK
jgi:hypothetical protein